MEAQTPAEGIMKTTDLGDSKFYKIACSCGNQDDELTMEVEADEAHVTVHVWTTVKTNWWDETWRKRYDIESRFLSDVHWAACDLVNGLWTRIKLTWNLWTKGYLKYESWAMLSEQQAYNFAEAIKQATAEVKEHKSSRNKTKK